MTETSRQSIGLLHAKNRRNFLAIVPYDNIYPPMNGGMQRCFHLLDQLANHFKLTVIMHQDEESFLAATGEYPSLKNCKVISTKNTPVPRDFFSLFPRKIATALRYRFWTRSLKGPADSNFLLYYPLLKQQLQFNTFDYVLLENITSLNSVKIFRRHNSKAVILYDAHNVDSQLAEEFLKKGQGERREYKIMKKKESSLHELVNGIIACSEKDLKQFEIMNGGKLKGAVIPNGVSLMKNGLDTDRESYIADHIIFCGSLDYEPNREGLSWFCKEIFPLILKQKPAARFMVVGKGDPGKELGRVLQSDFITYYGKVDDVNIFYAKAAVAIVPLLSGSGTRLKILEAMGRGVPVISTSKGAEGIGYTAGQNVLIADDKVAFAEAVLQLLSDRTLARSLVSKAYMLVKEYYDWDIIGNKLYAFIEAQ